MTKGQKYTKANEKYELELKHTATDKITWNSFKNSQILTHTKTKHILQMKGVGLASTFTFVGK